MSYSVDTRADASRSADAMTALPYVLLDDSLTQGPSTAPGTTVLYEAPERVVVAHTPHEVEAGLAAITQGLAGGLEAAGFFSYELGYCLEPKLNDLLPRNRDVPLFWVGLFRPPRRLDEPATRAWLDANGANGNAAFSDLRLSWTRDDYARAFARVQDYIAAGDVYQINLTLKYLFAFAGDPVALYAALRRKQRVAYGALIGTPDFHVLSLSPELFFRREGKEIIARPMKGTAPRGRTSREDARLKTWLAMDEKQRAENLMIVDLLRNDLGRIAKIGSVEVTDLFTVETYRSVHQMTSGITAELRGDVGVKDLLRALFPCGSVTGAPKVRAIEIIRELEGAPRSVYTGAIGRIAPNGDAQFNVAIRTVVIGKNGGEMGIGGGIVADSKMDAEFEECLLKAQFLTRTQAPFELIETIRYERDAGFHLLERHLARLKSSAAHFGYPFDRAAVLAALEAEAGRAQAPDSMVRLLLAEDGKLARGREGSAFLPQNHAARVLRPRDGAAEGAHRLRRGRVPEQEGRAHGGNAHHAVHRAGRPAVHAGARLRTLAWHAARGADRFAARRRERSRADARRLEAGRPHLSRQFGARPDPRRTLGPGARGCPRTRTREPLSPKKSPGARPGPVRQC
jgi:para-aminobenzoate synthetase/4-amino-4-deoxychorismate lyase